MYASLVKISVRSFIKPALGGTCQLNAAAEYRNFIIGNFRVLYWFFFIDWYISFIELL